jgi:antitoxin FitA
LARNVDEDLIRGLKERAVVSVRSPEAEHRAILEQALRPGRKTFAERAARWRRLIAGRETTDSAGLIRADRDRDHRGPALPRTSPLSSDTG